MGQLLIHLIRCYPMEWIMMKIPKVVKDSWIVGGVLIFLSILLNLVSSPDSLPFDTNFEFPAEKVLSGMFLSLFFLISIEIIFTHYKARHFKHHFSKSALLNFMLICLLAFSVLYIAFSIVIREFTNETYNWYEIIVFLMINLLIATIGLFFLFGKRLWKLSKFSESSYKLKVTSGNRVLYVDIEDIAYFYFCDKVVYLIQNNSQRLVTNFTLNQLEKHFEDDFFRVNRQALISHKSVIQFMPDKNRKLLVEVQPQFAENKFLKVSRYKAMGLKRWLDGLPTN